MKNGKYYAVYNSPYGTCAYGFDTDMERREFIEGMGKDFCGVPYPSELAAIKRGDMLVLNN